MGAKRERARQKIASNKYHIRPGVLQCNVGNMRPGHHTRLAAIIPRPTPS